MLRDLPVGSVDDTGSHQVLAEIVSASLVGRRVLSLLKSYTLAPMLYAPLRQRCGSSGWARRRLN